MPQCRGGSRSMHKPIYQNKVETLEIIFFHTWSAKNVASRGSLWCIKVLNLGFGERSLLRVYLSDFPLAGGL
jgi:hypothetical protein